MDVFVKIKKLERWIRLSVCFGNANKLHVDLTLAPQCVQECDVCVNKDLQLLFATSTSTKNMYYVLIKSCGPVVGTSKSGDNLCPLDHVRDCLMQSTIVSQVSSLYN